MIAFAEEAAERVEEEARVARRRGAGAGRRRGSAPRRTATERAIELLGRTCRPAEDAPVPSAEQIFGEATKPVEARQPAEAKLTAEQLFGPKVQEEPAAEEQPLSAAQMFGEEPTPTEPGAAVGGGVGDGVKVHRPAAKSRGLNRESLARASGWSVKH